MGGFPPVVPPYCDDFFPTSLPTPPVLSTYVLGDFMLIWQAIDMVGAGRRIPQGLRFDIINTLERYQMGEYAMARCALLSIAVTCACAFCFL